MCCHRRLVLVFFLCITSIAIAGDWTQFRGPQSKGWGSGLTVEPIEIGMQLDWRESLGSGYSSVVVVDSRVITQYTDGTSEILAAFDSRTGKPLWSYTIEAKYAGHDGSHDGSLATPLVIGETVFGVSPAGKLFAVSAIDGKQRWLVDMPETLGATVPTYGFGGSPIGVGDTIILQAGSRKGAVYGFAAADGELRWSAGEDSMQYQTPAVIQIAGQPVIVAVGLARLWGIDPADGAVLFQHEHGGGGAGYGAGCATPVQVGEGLVFVSHKDDGSAVFSITRDEDGFGVETVWDNNSIRHSYNSPVFHDGYLYGHSSRFLTCVDVATGKSAWKSRTPGDGYTILVDDYVVVLTREGSVHLIEATPEAYREVAATEVFEDLAWSPPSFSGGRVYARSLGSLAAVSFSNGGSHSMSQSHGAGQPVGSKFARLLNRLAAADDPDALAQQYIEQQESFPIVEDNWVHFVYYGEAEDVAVGSDLFGIASERAMQRVIGTRLFHASLRVENNTRANYVFFQDYEQGLDPRNSRKARSAVIGSDMELSFSGAWMEMSWFSMPGWKEPAHLSAAAANQKGVLQDQSLTSEQLGSEVTMQVYLPHGYEEGDRRYPVVYYHGASGALDEGGWDRSLDNLIGRSVDPLMVVFISPVRARQPTYAKMFGEELVPYIDANFRTVTDRSGRASVGNNFSAVGALFATFLNPDLIGKAATQSAFVTEFATLPMQSVLNELQRMDFELYIDWARYDLRSDHENWDLSEANAALVSLLNEKGMKTVGGQANDGAGWASWRNRTDALLQALFPLDSGE